MMKPARTIRQQAICTKSKAQPSRRRAKLTEDPNLEADGRAEENAG